MDNLLLGQKKKSFSAFTSAIACVLFIIFNLLFIEIYAVVPNSTIHGNLVISSEVTNNGKVYKVTSIEEKAFYASSDVKNITIEEGIESIGSHAFAGTHITSIFIPKSVEKISAPDSESSPFYACSKSLVIYLEADEIPEGFDEFWNYRTKDDPFEVKLGYTRDQYLIENKLAEKYLTNTDESQISYIFNDDGTATAVRGKEGFSKQNKVVYYLASFLVEFLFAVVSIIVAKANYVDFSIANGMNKKINGKIILWGLLISIVSLIFFSSATEFFMNVLYSIGYSPRNISIDIPTFGIYLLYVIISCLVPALFEELLFRGTILSGLKEFGFNVALFGSAAVFTLMHGSPDQTVHQFIIGLIVGYLFIKSGNLWLGVIVHFFNNFIAITEVYILQLANSAYTEEVVEEAAEEILVTNSISTELALFTSLITALIMGYFGYCIVKYLIRRMLEENEKLNKTEVAVASDVQTATISVNGVLTETEITISGENATEVSEDSESEIASDNSDTESNNSELNNNEDEVFAQTQQKEEPKEEKKQMSLSTKIMFIASGFYLVLQWIIALINGF